MSALFTGKIRGLTSGGSTVATQDVTLDSDDMLRWTDSNGAYHAVAIKGELAQLLTTIFTGGSGIEHRLMQ